MLDVTIDQASLDRIKGLLNRIDNKNPDGPIKRGVLKASTYVLNVLLYNVSGVILNIRTGNLARSMGMRVEQQQGNWTGIVGSGALIVNPQLSDGGQDVRAGKDIRMKYANILETGGRILPTGGRKYLTIPTKYALTPAGVEKFTALQVKAGQTEYDGSVIIFPYIFGYKTGFAGGKGGGVLKKRALTPLFKLVPSISIPPKKYLTRTAEAASPNIGSIMADEIEKELNK